MALRAALVFAYVCGCVSTSAVSCPDGRVCPAETVCDPVHTTCVTRAQTTACDELVDGVRCDADGVIGICDQGYCVSGCGDGTTDIDEQCDDGNFKSHDGCSSRCLDETAAWQSWQSPWTTRTEHAAVFQTDHNSLVLIGGDVPAGKSDEQWGHTPNGGWGRYIGATPPARSIPALAYDSNRDVIVMFGGTAGGNSDLGDTWELDGATAKWTQRTPVMSPSPRRGAGAVFDDVRNRVILFGGNTANGGVNETWEYDGVTWTQITATQSPPARNLPSFAWDRARQRAVMHGHAIFGDETWEYNAGSWTKITKSGPWPAGRFGAATGYWPGLGVVIFGGILATQQNAIDTWAFDGTGWTQIGIGPVAPPARSNATLTEVPGEGLVLVGGTTGPSAYADVWVFDGAKWIERTPRFSPVPRATQMAGDPIHGELVLFGGDGLIGVPLSDTWLFDGAGWNDVTPGIVPTNYGRSLPSLAYDGGRGRVVRFGGRMGFGTWTDELEEWDRGAQAWVPLPATAKPPVRFGAALAHDPDRNVLVLFGGANANGSGALGDTWEYAGSTWSNTSSTGPAPYSSPVIAYDHHRQAMIHVDAQGVTWTYAGGAWTRLDIASLPARSGTMMAYYPEIDRVVLFGGTGAERLYSDLWQLEADGWRELVVTGEVPPARDQAAFAAHPLLRTLVTFGGFGSNGRLEDTWSMQLRSTTLDEVCGDAIDNDEDLQSDDIDPDCAP